MLARAVALSSLCHRVSAYVVARRHLLSGREAALFAAVLGAIWFLPVLASHFTDGDAFYAHASIIPQLDHVGVAQAYAVIAGTYQHAQGGWFPVGGVPLMTWMIDSYFGVAKGLQYLLILATVVLFAAVAQRLLRSAYAAVLAVNVSIAAWQFRMPHDPVIGTSLVTPWAALLTLASLWAWLRFLDSNSKTQIAFACAFMVLAILSGPVSCAICVALCVYALIYRINGGAFLAGAAALAGSAVVLHGGLQQPWKHGGVYALNVFKQLFAALPTSYRATGHLPLGHVPSLYHNGVRYNDDRFINVPAPSRWAWIGILSATAGAYVSALRLRVVSADAGNMNAWIIGTILWIAPCLMLGPYALWPHGLPIGQSFDGVYFEYFGIGLVCAALLQQLSRQKISMPVLGPIIALAVFVSCYGDVRADAASLMKSARSDYARSVIQRAGTAGFFDQFEDGTVFAMGRGLVPTSAMSPQAQTLKYMIYHYSMRRFDIISEKRLTKEDVKNAWVIDTPLKAALILTAKRVASVNTSGVRTDRAFGYTPFGYVPRLAQTPRHGVRTTTMPLRDGYVIYTERLCGPVALDAAFAESRPLLVYGRGFFRSGPVGYEKPAEVRDAFGDVSTDPNMYPKMFMAHEGVLTLYRTSCPKAFVNLKAVAVSARPATLLISPSGAKTEHIKLTPDGAHFWLRFDMQKQRSPMTLHFVTNAPKAPQFDPIIFHYERDIPRDIRIVFEPEGIWEDRGNPDTR